MIEQLTKLLTSIKYPLFTEKSLQLTKEKEQYTFIVTKQLTKPELKFFVENFFNVKVLKINTMILPKQVSAKKRVKGYYSQYKKAFITLKKGFTITDLLISTI